MIFKLVMYYALAKGAWKGLHKRPPMTVADFDRILMESFVRPMQAWLNTPIDPELFNFDEIRVEAGSAR